MFKVGVGAFIGDKFVKSFENLLASLENFDNEMRLGKFIEKHCFNSNSAKTK